MSYIRQAQEALENLAGEEILMALVYLCDSYDVKAAADFDGETVASIPSGAMTVIKGVEVDDDFNLWYQVAFETPYPVLHPWLRLCPPPVSGQFGRAFSGMGGYLFPQNGYVYRHRRIPRYRAVSGLLSG